MTSRQNMTLSLALVFLILAIGAGIILQSRQAPAPVALQCRETNKGYTMICTDQHNNKTIWGKVK